MEKIILIAILLAVAAFFLPFAECYGANSFSLSGLLHNLKKWGENIASELLMLVGVLVVFFIAYLILDELGDSHPGCVSPRYVFTIGVRKKLRQHLAVDSFYLSGFRPLQGRNLVDNGHDDMRQVAHRRCGVWSDIGRIRKIYGQNSLRLYSLCLRKIKNESVCVSGVSGRQALLFLAQSLLYQESSAC